MTMIFEKDALKASATAIFSSASLTFAPDKISTVEDALINFLAASDPSLVPELIDLACSSSSEADTLLQCILERAFGSEPSPAAKSDIEDRLVPTCFPSQYVADIHSSSNDDWVEILESIPATSASSDPDAQDSEPRGYTQLIAEERGFGSGLSEDKNGAVADVADGLPTAISNPRAIPLLDELLYVEFQVWHNEPKPRQPQWVIKARIASSTEAIENGTLREFYFGFASDLSDLRYKIRRHAKDGRVSQEWANYFCACSHEIEPKQMMAQVTQNLYFSGQKIPAGKSSNERQVFEQFAVLSLDPTGSHPVALDLYLQAGEPIHLAKFTNKLTTKNDGKPRNKKAAQWVAYYDPDGFAAALKREAKALKKHRADQKQLSDYHPNTHLRAFYQPLLERIVALERQGANNNPTAGGTLEQMQRQLDALSKQVSALQYEVEVSRANVTSSMMNKVRQLQSDVESLKDQMPSSDTPETKHTLTRDEKLENAVKQVAGMRQRGMN